MIAQGGLDITRRCGVGNSRYQKCSVVSVEEAEAFRPKKWCPKNDVFCFCGVLWGWKEEEVIRFGSNRYFGLLITSFLVNSFCNFYKAAEIIGKLNLTKMALLGSVDAAEAFRPKEKSQKRRFFCLFGVLWGRKEVECTWFGSEWHFGSLNTSISRDLFLNVRGLGG